MSLSRTTLSVGPSGDSRQRRLQSAGGARHGTKNGSRRRRQLQSGGQPGPPPAPLRLAGSASLGGPSSRGAGGARRGAGGWQREAGRAGTDDESWSSRRRLAITEVAASCFLLPHGYVTSTNSSTAATTTAAPIEWATMDPSRGRTVQAVVRPRLLSTDEADCPSRRPRSLLRSAAHRIRREALVSGSFFPTPFHRFLEASLRA
jgi:hypothetical protein